MHSVIVAFSHSQDSYTMNPELWRCQVEMMKLKQWDWYHVTLLIKSIQELIKLINYKI